MSQPINRQVVNLLQNFIATLVDIYDLAILEAKLAGKSIVIILGIFLFIILLLTSVWFCLLGIIFFLLVNLGILWAFFLTALINLLLIIPLLWLAWNYLQNLGFSATKRQLAIKMEDKHESIKGTNSTL